MANPKQVCRLCLDEISDNYETLDFHKVEMLENICLQLDLSLTEDPLVCFECRDNLQQSYNFKMTCLNSGNYWETFVNRDSDSKPNLEEIGHGNIPQTRIKSEQESICKFCLNYSDIDSFVKFVMAEDTFFKDMLHKCLPEIECGVTDHSLICHSCMGNCQIMFSFVTNCLNNEQKVKEYIQANNTTGNGQIDLRNVKKYIHDIKIDKDNTTDFNFIKDQTPVDDWSYITVMKKEKLQQSEEDEIQIKSETDDSFSDGIVRESNSTVNPLLTNKSSPNTTMHKCTQCDYQGRQKYYIKRHMLVHKDSSEVTMFKCTQCNYESRYKYCLEKHLLIHKDNSEITMHKCTECKYATRHKHNLLQHLLIHKDNSEVNMHKCPECGYEGRYKYYIKKHMLVHKDSSEVTMHKCTMCSYESKYKNCIQKHMLNHKHKLEVTMHKCTKCNYESRYKYYVKKHMLVHRNVAEIPMHKCTECNYESRHKHNLQKHLLVHKAQKTTSETYVGSKVNGDTFIKNELT